MRNRHLLRARQILWLLIVIGAVTACREDQQRQPASPESKPLLPKPSSAALPPPVVIPLAPETRSEIDEVFEQSTLKSKTVFMPVVTSHFVATQCDLVSDSRTGSVSGTLNKWHPITISFAGPQADESYLDPNPFLDYRLQVQILGPSGQVYDVPGFYAGDGQGNGHGNVWQVRFSPEEAGIWHYCASFRTGRAVAIDLDPQAGVPEAFDGTAGVFEVTAREDHAPGFLKWGRLEYVGGHYLKFRDGPYWIKGGTDSPENFLGYAGFDNTYDQGGVFQDFLHAYTVHIDDWREGDPNFASVDRDYDGRGIIGALNYLSDQHVNSIYFLPMNLGGDGQDTYPFISADGTHEANTHYDISKLHQWGTVLEHAQEKGIALHVVLNENEELNRRWLDNGRLGVERMLFYRELVARFGYLLALKWNLSEEAVFTPDELRSFSDYLQALDWAQHPVSLHNPAGSEYLYEVLKGSRAISATAFQYDTEQAGDLVETWRQKSAESGRPWVIDMDENNPAGIGLSLDNAGQLRKTVLYDIYFSGGHVEWYAGAHDLPPGGDLNLEDFSTRKAMWNYMWYARRFMENYLPFWEMEPADELLTGESEAYGGGEVLAKKSQIYAIYLPSASPSGILRVDDGQKFSLKWYDPRSGEFVGEPLDVVASVDELLLNMPPNNPDEDWVVLISTAPKPDLTASPIAYP